ncbi:uncharacterized protein K489DRAFT_377600 [Dissoconium aciculare CBS 342.82]|uniref:HMG box domain-containing protein n=1 Tax=Dissoconium aciculare CBS 342.82 TaxID=1314786 RepID=A0A6J3MAL1_9PEZI|nr:uncharacterized protein K489DRAFT_377600 [Dissoconium aciculare CBS 342.82]KAF1825061.1 hypothetical protein K489DRAFT_377600 [Dissoconium aciculare CBS 342.82]
MANSASEKKTVVVDVERFVHTRNALSTSFLGLSNSIDKAVKAYIDHTQSVLEGDATLDLSLLIAPFDSLQSAAAVHNALAANSTDDLDGGKKKRKRNYKARDPNAPKRPLTAYFRYLQENRARIAGEIADGSREAGDVGKILTLSWNAMTPEEHEAYREDYKRECLKYDQAVLDYKAAGGKLDDEDDANPEEQDSSEVEPQQAKAKPASKKSAAAPSPAAPKTKAAAKPSASKKAAATDAAAAPTPKSAGKKSRPSTAAAADSDSNKPETPANKAPRKRKAPASKSDAAADEEAPKAKRGRKSKADKDADAADAKSAATPASGAAASSAATANAGAPAATPNSEAKKSKKAAASTGKKRKSEAAAASATAAA